MLKFYWQVRTNGVSQAAGIINSCKRCQDLLGDFFIEFDVLIKLGHDRTAQCFGFVRIDHLNFFRSGFATKVAEAIFNLTDFSPLRAFDEDLHGTVRQFEHLQNAGNAAHLIEVLN